MNEASSAGTNYCYRHPNRATILRCSRCERPICTECAIRTFTNESAYAAGKRGMDDIMRVLAKEVGPHNITVNQVAPGWPISARGRKNHTGRNEGYERTVPLRRRGQDQEIANMVAFLASDLAAFVTGQFIAVSGGTVMPAI